jgi:hypothetical protein
MMRGALSNPRFVNGLLEICASSVMRFKASRVQITGRKKVATLISSINPISSKYPSRC